MFHIAFSDADFKQYELINRPLWVQYQNGDISASELQQTRYREWAKKLKTTEQPIVMSFTGHHPNLGYNNQYIGCKEPIMGTNNGRKNLNVGCY